MKANQKLAPQEVSRSSNQLWNRYNQPIGTTLDDGFTRTYAQVYEHTRHTFQELFLHQNLRSSLPPTREQAPELATEEREFFDVLNAPEERRILRIVGDAGTGKSTFLRHLIDNHIRTTTNPPAVVTVDWTGFTSSLLDPFPEIYKHFAASVTASLSELLTREQREKLDSEIFDQERLFATDREQLEYSEDPVRERRRLIKERIAIDPANFCIARLNGLCRRQKNGVLLVFDNLDHLPAKTLDALQSFLIDLQTQAKPLIVVALRDHTETKRFSAYARTGVLLGWRMRINPPNTFLLIQKRLDACFPSEFDASKHVNVFARDEKAARVICHGFVLSAIRNADSYAFLNSWSNYNIRSLFSNIAAVLSHHGLSSTAQTQILTNQPVELSAEFALSALILDSALMFYPDRSRGLNLYWGAEGESPGDSLVQWRILQFLDNSREAILASSIKEQFAGWGYSPSAVTRALNSIVAKDLAYSEAGDPKDHTDTDGIRISYRGGIYARQLVSSPIYAYLMSFDTPPSSTGGLLGNVVKAELAAFSDWDKALETEAIGLRLHALATRLFEAEVEEVKHLRKRGILSHFRARTAARSLSRAVLEALSTLIRAGIEPRPLGGRTVKQATSRLEAQAADLSEQIAEAGWTDAFELAGA